MAFFLKITISHFVCVALRAFFWENNYFQLCLCCPAGSFFWKITISHFVCVALRAASILKNRIFYLYNFLHIAKLANFGGFEPREYPRTLSFEKWCRMH